MEHKFPPQVTLMGCRRMEGSTSWLDEKAEPSSSCLTRSPLHVASPFNTTASETPVWHLRSLPARLSEPLPRSPKRYLLILVLPSLPHLLTVVTKENLMHAWVIRARLRPLLLTSVLLCLPGSEVNVAFWARSTRFTAVGIGKRSAPECLDGRHIQGWHPGAMTRSQPDSQVNKDVFGSKDNRVKPYF
jgi:hypothetical protein